MIESARRAWDRFFFEPTSADPLALFRIAFSAVVLFNLLLLIPDLSEWYGPDGVLPLAVLLKIGGPSRLNVFAWLPDREQVAYLVVLATMASACCLLVGFRTRLASILLFVGLASLHHRNLYILNGSDTLLRNYAFLMMFAPSGAALSVDSARLRQRMAAPLVAPMIVPWSQRLLQLQMCVMYLTTVFSKLMGDRWWDGSAVSIVLQLDDFQRFPLPAFMRTGWFSPVATYSTLAIELALGTLIWFPRLRYPVMLLGVCFHLGVEYAANIPVFQWAAISGYLLFLKPATTDRWFGRPAVSSANRPKSRGAFSTAIDDAARPGPGSR